MKKTILKKISGSAITATLTLASISSAFAAVNVENYDSFTVTNSAAGTVLKETTNITNIYGKNVKLKDIKETSIDKSLVDTFIDSSYSETNIVAKDINHINADITEIKNSGVGTFVKQEINIKNLIEK